MTLAPKGSAASRANAPSLPEDAIQTLPNSNASHDRGNGYGIVMMQISNFGFVTNDTLTKLVGNDLSAGQLILIRGLFAILLIMGVAVVTGHLRHWRQMLHKAVVMRALLETAGVTFFILALLHLPLANITAIMLAVPMATTAGAALVLGDQVGWRRWIAIFIGFAGVVLIVRPGMEGFNAFALFGLGAVIVAAMRDIITRRIPSDFSLWMISLATMIASAAAGFVLILFSSWQPVAGMHLAYLGGSALFFTMGHYFLVIGMNHGEISVVSALRYSTILFALIYGYLLWADVPDLLTWIGILLILAAGLFTVYRERTLALAARRAKAAEQAK